MTDEYWKKRGQELPHYKPAHITQNKNFNDVLNSIPGLPPSQPNFASINSVPKQDGWKDISVGQMFDQIIQKKLLHSQQYQETQPITTVMLREGHKSFRQLQMQIPTDISLAINEGVLNGVSGKEFEYKGTRQFYILKNQHETIDVSKIDRSQLINLAVVSAPFMGTILVPENAVIRQQNKGMQLLKG